MAEWKMYTLPPFPASQASRPALQPQHASFPLDCTLTGGLFSEGLAHSTPPVPLGLPLSLYPSPTLK